MCSASFFGVGTFDIHFNVDLVVSEIVNLCAFKFIDLLKFWIIT